MNKYLLVITVLLFTLQSCVKDQTGFEPNSNIPLYTNDILGVIEDESGAPIEGVRVMYDGQEALTDIFGVYQFKNVKVSSDQSFLSIEKTGYFAAGRSFSSVGNGTIKLKTFCYQRHLTIYLMRTKGARSLKRILPCSFLLMP
jgi:hypothetical protein